MKRRHPLYQHEPYTWNAMPLVERLAYLRRELCDGPCGAAYDPRKETLDKVMREAIAALEEKPDAT